MPVLSILHFPDERLRTQATAVKQVDNDVQQIIKNMSDTMYAHDDCVALAATQVDIHQQIIVIDISETRDQRIVLINPVLLTKHGKTSIEEGCMSLPESYGFVPRAETISIRALNYDGNEFILDAEGFLAICIQHEMDHLDGKLFVDYLSPLKHQRIRQKPAKNARLAARTKTVSDSQ